MVGIVLDTNVLNSGSRDFTQAQFVSKLEDITREIESNDFYSEVVILLPQIVIDELFEHQISSYYGAVEGLCGLKIPDAEFVIKENYEEFLSLRFKESLANLNSGGVRCEILPYPPEATLVPIIQRAVKKKPPFEGVGKQSDKGFKDVLLWETLLDYKRNNAHCKIILVSHDKQLIRVELAQEFQAEFNDILYQFSDTLQLYQELAKLCEQEYHQTFGESVKQRLIDWMTDDMMGEILIGEELELWEGRFKIVSVKLQKVSILDIEDAISKERKMVFDVLCPMEIGVTSQQEEYLTDEGCCKIGIEYSFDKDGFDLRNLRSEDWGLDITF